VSCPPARRNIDVTVLTFDNRHIENINKFEGVEWVTMETICDTFKAKNKPPKGALLPAEPGAILKDRDLKLKVQE
jgi:hypothetical protein